MGLLSKIPRNAYGFCIRMVLFLIIYSVSIWKYIDINNTLYDGGVFANVPYIDFLIFPCVGLFLLARWSEIKEMERYRNGIFQTLIFLSLAVGAYLVPASFLVMNQYVNNMLFSIYVPLLLSQMFFLFAIFNFRFIKKFSRDFALFTSIILIMLLATYTIEHYWKVLSGSIMGALHYILPLIDSSVKIVVKSYSITMKNFKVNIGATCSGVYSIVAFSLLFITALYFASIKHRINRWLALIALLSGMVAVFILNIIRIVVIILVGAYYSPKLAIQFFHEYLSAMFLLGLFFLYLKYIIPKIVTKDRTPSSTAHSSL